MIGLVFGKVKSFLVGVLSILSAVFGFLFLLQTFRYRELEKEKEELEEENREQREVIEQIQDDVHLTQTLREKEKEIDERTSEEVRKIEDASDDDVLRRLNRLHD